jgi:hypothetical protein
VIAVAKSEDDAAGEVVVKTDAERVRLIHRPRVAAAKG